VTDYKTLHEQEVLACEAAEAEAARLREALGLADALADRFEAIDTRAHDFGRANELVAYREARAALDGGTAT
jgi:hypothetical protein